MNQNRPSRRSPRPVLAMMAILAMISLIGVSCTDDTGTRWEDRATVTGSDDGATVDESDDVGADEPDETTQGFAVVASTTWIGALAKAAGAEDITVIAPADLQHQSDYDPKPSDLALLADADFVLLAGFEGFADRLTDAVGSDAEVVQVEAVNTLDSIHSEVDKLAGLFGTKDTADAWIADFDARVAELRQQIDDARPTPAPTVVVHQFMEPWVAFSGVESVGAFGPAPVSAAQLAEFIDADPDLIFDNAHVPSGSTLDDLGVPKVSIINFPPDSLELIQVFEENTASIIAAFEQLAGNG